MEHQKYDEKQNYSEKTRINEYSPRTKEYIDDFSEENYKDLPEFNNVTRASYTNRKVKTNNFNKLKKILTMTTATVGTAVVTTTVIIVASIKIMITSSVVGEDKVEMEVKIDNPTKSPLVAVLESDNDFIEQSLTDVTGVQKLAFEGLDFDSNYNFKIVNKNDGKVLVSDDFKTDRPKPSVKPKVDVTRPHEERPKFEFNEGSTEIVTETENVMEDKLADYLNDSYLGEHQDNRKLDNLEYDTVYTYEVRNETTSEVIYSETFKTPKLPVVSASSDVSENSANISLDIDNPDNLPVYISIAGSSYDFSGSGTKTITVSGLEEKTSYDITVTTEKNINILSDSFMTKEKEKPKEEEKKEEKPHRRPNRGGGTVLKDTALTLVSSNYDHPSGGVVTLNFNLVNEKNEEVILEVSIPDKTPMTYPLAKGDNTITLHEISYGTVINLTATNKSLNKVIYNSNYEVPMPESSVTWEEPSYINDKLHISFFLDVYDEREEFKFTITSSKDNKPVEYEINFNDNALDLVTIPGESLNFKIENLSKNKVLLDKNFKDERTEGLYNLEYQFIPNNTSNMFSASFYLNSNNPSDLSLKLDALNNMDDLVINNLKSGTNNIEFEILNSFNEVNLQLASSSGQILYDKTLKLDLPIINFNPHFSYEIPDVYTEASILISYDTTKFFKDNYQDLKVYVNNNLVTNNEYVLSEADITSNKPYNVLIKATNKTSNQEETLISKEIVDNRKLKLFNLDINNGYINFDYLVNDANFASQKLVIKELVNNAETTNVTQINSLTNQKSSVIDQYKYGYGNIQNENIYLVSLVDDQDQMVEEYKFTKNLAPRFYKHPLDEANLPLINFSYDLKEVPNTLTVSFDLADTRDEKVLVYLEADKKYLLPGPYLVDNGKYQHTLNLSEITDNITIYANPVKITLENRAGVIESNTIANAYLNNINVVPENNGITVNFDVANTYDPNKNPTLHYYLTDLNTNTVKEDDVKITTSPIRIDNINIDHEYKLEIKLKTSGANGITNYHNYYTSDVIKFDRLYNLNQKHKLLELTSIDPNKTFTNGTFKVMISKDGAPAIDVTNNITLVDNDKTLLIKSLANEDFNANSIYKVEYYNTANSSETLEYTNSIKLNYASLAAPELTYVASQNDIVIEKYQDQNYSISQVVDQMLTEQATDTNITYTGLTQNDQFNKYSFDINYKNIPIDTIDIVTCPSDIVVDLASNKMNLASLGIPDNQQASITSASGTKTVDLLNKKLNFDDLELGENTISIKNGTKETKFIINNIVKKIKTLAVHRSVTPFDQESTHVYYKIDETNKSLIGVKNNASPSELIPEDLTGGYYHLSQKPTDVINFTLNNKLVATLDLSSGIDDNYDHDNLGTNIKFGTLVIGQEFGVYDVNEFTIYPGKNRKVIASQMNNPDIIVSGLDQNGYYNNSPIYLINVIPNEKIELKVVVDIKDNDKLIASVEVGKSPYDGPVSTMSVNDTSDTNQTTEVVNESTNNTL